MINPIERLEKKLILRNNLLIKKGVPRLPGKDRRIKLNFEGNDALSEMVKSGNAIFSDFNSATSVLVKINLNSSNPYPASTSFDMIGAVLDSLTGMGVKKICIGDCSGLMHLPTRKIISRKGFYRFKKYGVKIKVFDYGGWVKIPVNGIYFKNIILSDSIYKYDKIINLANLKSHSRSEFSFSIKLLVGFMHPAQRLELHRDHLQERIAELPLAVQPDISIVDARSIFVDGGPDTGKTAEAKTIIIDNDLLEADLAAYDLLFSLKNQYGINNLSQDPYDNLFFRHFARIKKDRQ